MRMSLITPLPSIMRHWLHVVLPFKHVFTSTTFTSKAKHHCSVQCPPLSTRWFVAAYEYKILSLSLFSSTLVWKWTCSSSISMVWYAACWYECPPYLKIGARHLGTDHFEGHRQCHEQLSICGMSMCVSQSLDAGTVILLIEFGGVLSGSLIKSGADNTQNYRIPPTIPSIFHYARKNSFLPLGLVCSWTARFFHMRDKWGIIWGHPLRKNLTPFGPLHNFTGLLFKEGT